MRKTFIVLISLCNIFFRWRSLSPSMIWMANRQTVSSGRGLPIWPFMYWAKSPPEQYYIQIYSFSFSMNDWKYLTMYGELMFFIILTSFMAYLLELVPTNAFVCPSILAQLPSGQRLLRLPFVWLCRLTRKILNPVCSRFNILLNSCFNIVYKLSLSLNHLFSLLTPDSIRSLGGGRRKQTNLLPQEEKKDSIY